MGNRHCPSLLIEYGNQFKRYVSDKEYRFDVNLKLIKSDRIFLKKRYKQVFGKKLDLKNPETFNEKLQWLKLYDRNPLYTVLVDKYAVKKYVADIIGEEYIIPTLAVYDSADEIDFESLPDKFVLKCTHNSGLGMCICNDKKAINKEKIRQNLKIGISQNYYMTSREWPYKNVPKKIIAEKYMEDAKFSELRDYKFFCFNGQVKLMFTATNRSDPQKLTFDFFDADYNHLPIKSPHPLADTIPERPENFYLMKELAEKLSADIPHVRIDFYEANGKVYFGEMTFYHWSGFMPFSPPEWDKKIGNMLILPKSKRRNR